MEDRTDNHLNIVGVVSEYKQLVQVIVIATIGGGVTLRKGPNAELKGLLPCGFIPDVCFAPLNCFAYNTTKLVGGQVLGLCLKIYFHLTKIQQSSGTTKTIFLSIKSRLPLI